MRTQYRGYTIQALAKPARGVFEASYTIRKVIGGKPVGARIKDSVPGMWGAEEVALEGAIAEAKRMIDRVG